jgi:hypothetical protein
MGMRCSSPQTIRRILMLASYHVFVDGGDALDTVLYES